MSKNEELQPMDYITPKEVQEILHISKNTCYRLINQKNFSSIKIGNRHKIPVKEFNAYLKKHMYGEIELFDETV